MHTQTLRLTDEQRARLERIAKEYEVSLADAIRLSIRHEDERLAARRTEVAGAR
jgi:predicted transcriptional regulator